MAIYSQTTTALVMIGGMSTRDPLHAPLTTIFYLAQMDL
jgi:hypothetical protein